MKNQLTGNSDYLYISETNLRLKIMGDQIFDKGDKVVLKSGGSIMTVKGYKSLAGIGSNPDESETEVVCAWHDGVEIQQRTFHQDALELAE